MAQTGPQKNYYGAYKLGTKPGGGVPNVDEQIKTPIYKYSVRVVKEGGDDDGYEFSSSTQIGVGYEKDRETCENIYFQLIKKNPAFQSPGAYFYDGQGTLYSTVKIPLEEAVIFGILICPEQRQMFRMEPDHTVFEAIKSQLEWTKNIPILANGTPLRNMYQNDYGLYYPRRNEIKLLDKSPTEHYVLDTQQILFAPKEDLDNFRTKRSQSAAQYQTAIHKSVTPKFHSNGELQFGMEEDSIVSDMKKLPGFQPKTDHNHGFVKSIEEKYFGVEFVLSPRAANVLNIADNQKKVLFVRTGPSANNIGFFQNENFLTVNQHYYSMLNYPDLFTAFVTNYDNQVMLVPVEFLCNPPQSRSFVPLPEVTATSCVPPLEVTAKSCVPPPEVTVRSHVPPPEVTTRSCVPNEEALASTNDVLLENKPDDPKQLSKIPNKELDALDISQKSSPFSSSQHVFKFPVEPPRLTNPMGRGGLVNKGAPMVRGFPGIGFSRPSTSSQGHFAIPQSLQKWTIFYDSPQRAHQNSYYKIEVTLSNAMKGHGMNVGRAQLKKIVSENLNVDGIKEIFVNAQREGEQLILFLLPKKYKMPERCAHCIKFCSVSYNIPSQTMKAETIDLFDKINSTLSYDFAGKTNLKLGGINKVGRWDDDILLVGISFPPDRCNNAGVVGYAHNMVKNSHTFAGKFIFNKNLAQTDREIIQSILKEISQTVNTTFHEIWIYLQGCNDMVPILDELWKTPVPSDKKFDISVISLMETFAENPKKQRYTSENVFFVEEVRQEKTEISEFKIIATTLNNEMDKTKNVTNWVCEDRQINKKSRTIPTPLYVARKELQVGYCVKEFTPDTAF